MSAWTRTNRTTVCFESSTVRIRAYRCRGDAFGPPHENVCSWHSVLFVRSGRFRKQTAAGRAVIADPNWAVFFNRGESYRLTVPVPFDDRVTELEIRPRVLAEMVESIAPGVDEPMIRPFARAAAPVDARLFRRHMYLWRAVAAPGGSRVTDHDPLAIEEQALDIAATTLGARFEPARPSASPRTAAAHADLAQAAMLWLGDTYHEQPTLDRIADAVDVSPFHLCRVFRAQTGLSVHRYLDRLRLREALRRLLDSRPDLTSLALDLGYSSHSHFTTSFRREFGITPSSVSTG